MSRAIFKVFEDYQKSIIAFVNTVAELAIRPQNIDALFSGGVVNLLKTLLLDPVPSVQQSASLAIGRLANHSEEIAESIIQNDIISSVIFSLSNQNRFFKKASCFVLRAIAKHSVSLAEDIVNCGAIQPLANCLNDLDPSVKESSAWVLGYIAKHNERLANHIKESKAIDSLLLCLKEPDISLKRSVIQTLSYISQHSEELAITVTKNGIDNLVNLIHDHDMILKRNICQLLGNISKHSIKLSDMVLKTLGKPTKLIYCLKDPDHIVRKNSAYAILELVNKSPENSKAFIDIGGVSAIVEYISSIEGDSKMYGILALGFLASNEEHFAKSMFDYNKTLPLLRDIIMNENNQQLKSAVCFTLGNLGKHSTQHANLVSNYNVLALMLLNYQSNDSNENLKKKAKRALKNILSCCQNILAMEPLIQVAPRKMIKQILNQFAICLKLSGVERKNCLQKGVLQRLVTLKNGIKKTLVKDEKENKEKSKEIELDEKIVEIIEGSICTLFPDEIVKHYNYDEFQKNIEEFIKESNEF